jgi:hypothetical protein
MTISTGSFKLMFTGTEASQVAILLQDVQYDHHSLATLIHLTSVPRHLHE